MCSEMVSSGMELGDRQAKKCRLPVRVLRWRRDRTQQVSPCEDGQRSWLLPFPLSVSQTAHRLRAGSLRAGGELKLPASHLSFGLDLAMLKIKLVDGFGDGGSVSEEERQSLNKKGLAPN